MRCKLHTAQGYGGTHRAIFFIIQAMEFLCQFVFIHGPRVPSLPAYS